MPHQGGSAPTERADWSVTAVIRDVTAVILG